MERKHESSETPLLSRRRLLQLLGASGAAVALERLLPGQWSKPSVDAAPAAFDPVIGDLAMFWRPVNSSYSQGLARWRYLDELGDINSSSPLFAISSEGTIANGLPLSTYNGMVIPYTANQGTVRLPMPFQSSYYNSSGVALKLAIAAASDPGRQSNVLSDNFPVGPMGTLNISDLTIGSPPAFNSSVGTLAVGNCTEPVAMFSYNGSLMNMVQLNTSVYAFQNTAGWISAGGDIANMGGVIMPNDSYGGRVYLPLAPTVNSAEPIGLALFLEDLTYYYYTEDRATYEGCVGPHITSLTNQLCGPWVDDGRIGCRYDVMIGYYDPKAAMGPDARLTIKYEGLTLVDNETLGDLGLSVSDPQTGTLALPVLLPEMEQNGFAHPLRVMLVNEDGEEGPEGETLVTQFCEAVPAFPLTLNTSGAMLVNNSTTEWLVRGTFNDSAGLVGNSSLVTAVLNSAIGGLRTLYNAVPLDTVGVAYIRDYYNYFPSETVNCTLLPINGGLGDILIDVNTNGNLARVAVDEPVDLTWFLTEPQSRDSGQSSITLDPGEEPVDEMWELYLPTVRRS